MTSIVLDYVVEGEIPDLVDPTSRDNGGVDIVDSFNEEDICRDLSTSSGCTPCLV